MSRATFNYGIRDNYLGLDSDSKSYWINQSLYAQRIGALPPYNDLLGAKMVALSLVSNEIRERYAYKYKNTKTNLKKRVLPNRLMFLTTASGFGKSSIYERLKYNNELICKFLGYTQGSGTFHLSEELFGECLQYLNQLGINTKRGWGTGASRKMKLVIKAFRKLGFPNFEYHQVQRGFYILENIANLNGVIHNGESPE